MHMDLVFEEMETKMKRCLDSLLRDLTSIRTGRASVNLLDSIKIDYYGTATPLNQASSISTPDTSSILIQPWDKTLISAIEKSLLSSDLGLTPANDGNVIRLSIPPLTEERRIQLVKIVKKIIEESKIAIRNIRREGVERLKNLEKDKKATEDDLRKALEKVQKITDSFIKDIDNIFVKKEKEILKD